MAELKGQNFVELNFEGSHIGIWEWPEVESSKLIWSDRSQEILGIELENRVLSLTSFRSIIHPDDIDEFFEKLNLHVTNNVNFNCEFRILREGSSGHWVQMKGQAKRGASGEALSMSGILLDIHDRKEVEIQTEESLAFLLNAEQASSIGSIKWNPLKDEVWVSKNAKRLLGLEEDHQGNSKETLNHIAQEEKENVLQSIYELASLKKDIDISFSMAAGQAKDLALKCSYYENEWTGGSYYIGLVQDQTELKTRERQVEELIANLKRSNEELEKFAYIASHDLQEPLRKIQTFGDRLLHISDALPDKEKHYIERMQNAAQRMQALIRDLLDYSRASRNDKANIWVDLNELFNILIDDLEGAIQHSGAKIEISELPTIKGNEKQLYRLFQNLLSNAIKFRMTEGIPEVKIRCEEVSAKVVKTMMGIKKPGKKKYYRIEIEDNGIGFEEEFAEKIFTIFQRLHGRNEYEGTGIGLAVCKKIVENHSGFIMAKSKVREGTSFFVFLPKTKKK